MKEQLITFETAVLAKEKDFNWESSGKYIDNKLLSPNGWITNWNKKEYTTTSAPTQSLLQKWLREVHGIHVTITNHESRKEYFENHYFYIIDYDLLNSLDKNLEPKYLFKTYEEALENGLQEALNLIKLKKK